MQVLVHISKGFSASAHSQMHQFKCKHLYTSRYASIHIHVSYHMHIYTTKSRSIKTISKSHKFDKEKE